MDDAYVQKILDLLFEQCDAAVFVKTEEGFTVYTNLPEEDIVEFGKDSLN